MKIAFGSDHAGFPYKERLKELVQSLGHEAQDFGTHSTEEVDYPLFIRPAAQAVAAGTCDRAIILGGSGNGEAIVANRIPGVRATVCWSEYTAEVGRRHNDSNCLSLGERTVTLDLAEKIVRIWLDTPFDGGRHARRLAEIDSAR
ncbi:MAG TPA: ribose 5-phosphate isomerase B [Pirellulales bacterium]|nr:ribose 5-phosphate isomerase B [Pirellulales bacterium]